MILISSEEVLNTNDHKTTTRRNKRKILDGPTLSSEDVARELGVSKQWVLQLANRSEKTHPDNYLEGYIKRKDGEGWERKQGPSAHRAEVFFYRTDVDGYKLIHPEIEEDELDLSDVEVEEELRKLIIEKALPELTQYGYVTRTRIRDILQEDHGYSDRVYKKIMRVAQDLNWPLPKQQKKRTAKYRRGKKVKKAG